MDQSFQSGRIKSEQIFKERLHIRAKGVRSLAFDIDRADQGIAPAIEHWDNDLRPYGVVNALR